MKNTRMVWMNKLLKESPSLTHSSLRLNVFLFNFWFHKSGNFLGWKDTFYTKRKKKKLGKHDIPKFFCKNSQKLKKIAAKKRIKNPWQDLNFKIDLDLHGECKRQVWFLRVILCHPWVHLTYVIKRCLHT